jgi:hypothetical protein
MLAIASAKPFLWIVFDPLVNTSNQNVLQASVLEIGEHLQPEAGPFTFRNVHTDQIFAAFPVKSQNIVDSTGYDFTFVFDLVMHAV